MPKSAPASPPARARSRATQETRSREGGTDKPTGGPHHARALRSHRVARAIGLVLTGALVFVAVGAGAVYLDLKSKITVSDVSEYVVGMPTE